MQEFLRDLESRFNHLPPSSHTDFIRELTELLAWAHHRFLWIHPFQDYNGRIGRLLINMILLNLNLPTIELKVETMAGRLRYIKALHAADIGDLRLLEKIIEEALIEAAGEAEREMGR